MFLVKPGVLCLVLLVLSACPTGQIVDPQKYVLSEVLNNRITNPMDESQPLGVYFATNRKLDSSKIQCDDNAFGVYLDNVIRMGICEVNVPDRHPIGGLDEPGTFSGRNRDLHFGMLRHQNLPEADLFARVKSAPGHEALLFVHGFNVKFQEAIYRAAQIAYDSKFQGPVMAFTWPSGARPYTSILMTRTYGENQANARASIAAAVDFLTKLGKTGKKIHIVIHSMGHQVILPAIAQMVVQGKKDFLGELILNAPDFPVKRFRTLAPKLLTASDRVTLYCSPGDNALAVSEQVNGNKRIGNCGRVDGVDVINVNEIDAPTAGVAGTGHSYYSSRPIMTDIYQVILGIKASKRLFIRRSKHPRGGEHYILRR